MLETFVGVPGVIFAMSFRYVKDILLNESEKLFDVVYAQVNTLSDMSHVAYSFIFELLYAPSRPESKSHLGVSFWH